MKRKLRKLLRDPGAFTRDMVRNRVEDIRRLLPTPPPGRPCRRYTVVAAVYGVEKYLDDFIGSLVRQTLDFERHIELVLVDDGSPDGSAAVIANWQRRYPRSIRYLRKENGGQASARNLGLEHATGDWVTFIDPDDFVDERYFEKVDALLARPDAAEAALVCCDLVFFDEATRQLRDTHPLRRRFAAGDRVIRWDASTKEIQLSASTALFRRDVIRRNGLRFDEGIRPTFEDGHFTARFVLAAGEPIVGLAASAKYYYRKRADESSTLDRSWSHPGRYDDVLRAGYLDLLQTSARLSPDGRAAKWVQRTVLYDVFWYLKRLVNHGETVSFLTDEERRRFKSLLVEIMGYVDTQTVMEFDLAGAWLYYKIGVLGLFKGETPSFQHVYVHDYDETKGLVQLNYFHRGEPDLEVFESDEGEIFPVFAKTRRHDFLGEEFVSERLVWLPIRGMTGKLRIRIGDQLTKVLVRGRFHHGGVPVRDLERRRKLPDPVTLPLKARLEHELAHSPPARALYRDAFLFMDRDTQADDNAEHLYRYVRATRPDINAYFVLRRTSHDWDRLEREGFRLLAFGAVPHRLALLHAKHVISSHADHYVLEHPGGRELTKLMQAKYTFLQHGVIATDLSGWLNPKSIDCFVTASPREHASIAEDGPYKFSAREVVLTGLPRHDALGASVGPPERALLIMPTWRRSLAGLSKGGGHERVLNPAFYESGYAQTWKALLHSPELRRLAEEHGYRVRFFPHANIHPYLDWFAPPAFVETLTHRAGESIQDVFRSASILLTDYSSVAYELAYLRRATVYYQFDRDFVFGGGHTTRQGYFDFDRDGFGPVCRDAESLLREIETLMRAGGTPAPEHAARMERAFAFRDGRSCHRTLEAILDLDRPHGARDRSAELLVEAARSASRLRSWTHAERRWELVMGGDPEQRPHDAELRLAEAKRELGKVDEAAMLLRALAERPELQRELADERAALATAAEDWKRALDLWAAQARAAHDERASVRASVRIAEAKRRLGDLGGARRVLASIPEGIETLAVLVERAELASAEQRWSDALARWTSLAERRRPPEQSLLRIAEALAALGRPEQALGKAEAYLAGRPRHERHARALRLGLLDALEENATEARITREDAPVLRAVGRNGHTVAGSS